VDAHNFFDGYKPLVLGTTSTDRPPFRSAGRPEGGTPMIVLGIVLLIVGIVLNVGILYTLGIILVVVGAVLFLLGSMGHAIGGRSHYW
jgi:hypothetical protein